MLNVIKGATEKQAIAEELVSALESRIEEGYLYIGYPVLGSMGGKIKVDMLLVSRAHGMVIFDIDMGNESIEKIDMQDEIYNNMESRLKKYNYLSERRKLMVCINVVTYAPRWKSKVDEAEVCTTITEVTDYVDNISWEHEEYYDKMVESVQLISQIKKRGNRNYVQHEESKGGKLKKIEDQISCLDKFQSKAVIETINGVQRIRGLAGSGKTIVLALKVAYLYTMYEEKVIAVTFNSRSLKGQFYQLVTNFIIENTNEEPDWDRIRIIHAWGSNNTEGLYFDFCKQNNLKCYDYQEACKKYGRDSTVFTKICKEALDEAKDIRPLFDVILVDEAQDFSKYFLQMCYLSLPKESKMLVYAYDELQSLDNNNVETPEEIFGNVDGKPNVVLDNSNGKMEDIVLFKCYRNSRPVLTTAHGLGFGIYREKPEKGTQLVQLFEDKQLWEDIGYKILEGSLTDEQRVVLSRTEESSPKFLEQHSDIDDLIIFRCFDNIQAEAEWIVEDIVNNLESEELKHKDIMIIHPDPLTTKKYVSDIRVMLMKKNINSHIVGVQTTPDNFFQEDSIAISQIYRAKGNEAAVVYLVNANACYSGVNLSRKRNILFTAMTRSKAWVRVTGTGTEMEKLINEYQRVKESKFVLDFSYPNKEEREKMRIIHRDKTRDQILEINKNNIYLDELTLKINNGEIQREDLDAATLQKLKEMLFNESEK